MLLSAFEWRTSERELQSCREIESFFFMFELKILVSGFKRTGGETNPKIFGNLVFSKE